MALLEEVVSYLAANGIGTFGVDIFIGSEPKSPTNVVTLYPTGGSKIGRRHWIDRDTPTIQVRVRNSTYVAGWNKAVSIFELLDTPDNILDTLKGRCFALQSQPTLIGRGENSEFIFTHNYRWQLIRA